MSFFKKWPLVCQIGLQITSIINNSIKTVAKASWIIFIAKYPVVKYIKVNNKEMTKSNVFPKKYSSYNIQILQIWLFIIKNIYFKSKT